MRVRFWGTRGSIATPGPTTVRYGGNTSCVEVRSDSGDIILIDCGTGANALGQALQKEGAGATGHILISHTHWDHIQGLPFFAPLFVGGNEWHIYGPRGLGQSLRDVLAGQMDYAYFPVALNAFAATVHFHEVVEGAFTIGDVRVETRYLNHPALTVGYRIEADGASMVYASDHEPHNPDAGQGHGEVVESGDIAHVDFIRDADLVIHDAQYTAAEYPAKIGWGHSTIEYVVDAAIAGDVEHVVLFHHDPARTDAAVDDLVLNARQRAAEASAPLRITAAAEGDIIELRGKSEPTFAPFMPSSLVNPAHDLLRELVLVAGVSDEECAILAGATEADSIATVTAPIEKLSDAIDEHEPSLVFLGDANSNIDPVSVCAALRAAGSERAAAVPVIIVTDQAKVSTEQGEASGVTDWLTRPYSVQYARSKMRAWMMRSMLRWRKAALPPNEQARLAAVHGLGILDTQPEERFDRHTRIAGAALDAPIALVTLVDRERQWFKSHQGFDFSETPRDVGFCSHAILEEQPLVVTDALKDDRFAENPAVIGDPRVRFYAGIPLCTPDGTRVGAFCIVDHKPRTLSAAQLRMLQDIARLVEEELQVPSDPALSPAPRAPLRA